MRLKHTPLNHIDQERPHRPFPPASKVPCLEVSSECTVPHSGKREPRVYIRTPNMVGYFLGVPTLVLPHRNYRVIYLWSLNTRNLNVTEKGRGALNN